MVEPWLEEAQQEVLDRIDRQARKETLDVDEVVVILKSKGEHDLASAYEEYCEESG